MRSKPSATPAQSGSPAASAASSRSSSARFRQAAAAALGVVRLEARALLGGGRQFVEAVGELHAVAVQLKALRRARVLRVEARQRRLARRDSRARR